MKFASVLGHVTAVLCNYATFHSISVKRGYPDGVKLGSFLLNLTFTLIINSIEILIHSNVARFSTKTHFPSFFPRRDPLIIKLGQSMQKLFKIKILSSDKDNIKGSVIHFPQKKMENWVYGKLC